MTRAKPLRTTWVTPIFPSRFMSTILSTLLLLIVGKPTQTLLTRPLRECQLISAYANSAHRAQADQLTLNQQVPGSSPGRRTKQAHQANVKARVILDKTVSGDPLQSLDGYLTQCQEMLDTTVTTGLCSY